MPEYRESYHLRCTKDQAVEILRSLNLKGFILAEANGWSALCVEGLPFTDNSVLRQLQGIWVLHFFDVKGGTWVLRLFHDGKLMAEIMGSPDGHSSGELWESLATLMEAPDLSPAERDLISKLTSGFASDFVCDPNELAAFLGLPEEWLNYQTINQWPEWQTRLPPGSEHVMPLRKKHRPVFEMPAISEIEYPCVGFGTHRDVRAAFRPLVSEAMKAHSWATLGTLERRPFVELGRDVMLAEGLFMYKQDVLAWRPYCMVDAFVEAIRRRKFDSLKRLTYARLMISRGADDFWVALCLLAGIGELDKAVLQMSREMYVEMLSVFVRWIRHIEALSTHFVDTMGSEGWNRYPFWSRGIISAAYLAGWKLEPLRLEGEFAGDWLEALIQTGVIEISGNDFAITDDFASR